MWFEKKSLVTSSGLNIHLSENDLTYSCRFCSALSKGRAICFSPHCLVSEILEDGGANQTPAFALRQNHQACAGLKMADVSPEGFIDAERVTQGGTARSEKNRFFRLRYYILSNSHYFESASVAQLLRRCAPSSDP